MKAIPRKFIMTSSIKSGGTSFESPPQVESKVPKLEEFFFEKLSWRVNPSDRVQEAAKGNLSKESSRKSNNENASNYSQDIKIPLDVVENEENIKKNKNTVKPNFLRDLSRFSNVSQEMNIVTCFSIIGRIVRFMNKIKEKISYGNISNLNRIQFDLLNDNCYIPDGHFRDKKKDYLAAKSIDHSWLRGGRSTSKLGKDSSKTAFVSKKAKISRILKKIKMFHPLSQYLIFWKAFLCFFIVVENFSLTIRLFFDLHWDKPYQFVSFFQTALKVFLFIDIFVVCNTGIFKSGAVSFNRREAMVKYLRKKFILDFIALASLLMPFSGNAQTTTPALLLSSMNIFKLFFLLKLRQLSSVYKYLEEMLFIDEAYEGMLSLVKLFMEVIVISHFITCFWVYVAYDEKQAGNLSWIDKAFTDTDDYLLIEWNRAYLYAWYWSLTTMITVGYGDISPRNDKEVAVASIAMLFGCGFFAYAISSIGIIVERFNTKKKNLKKVLRVINKYMKRKAVDYDVQIKIRKYLEHLWLVEEIENKELEEEIMDRLSSSLKEELLVQSHGKVLAKFELFTSVFSVETMEKVSQIVQSVNYAPEDIIIYEGEASNNLIYFIIKGEVELYHINSKTHKSSRLRILKEGECFGQLGFFTEMDREVNARSKGFTTLYTIKRQDFLDIVKTNQLDFENFHFIKDKINLYNDISCLGLICESCRSSSHILKNCPYLNYIPNRETVIRKYLYSEENDRADYLRKINKSPNALINKYEQRSDEGENSDDSQEFTESTVRNTNPHSNPQNQEKEKDRERDRDRERDINRPTIIIDKLEGPELEKLLTNDVGFTENLDSKHVEIIFDDPAGGMNKNSRTRIEKSQAVGRRRSVFFNQGLEKDELTSVEEKLFKRAKAKKTSSIRLLPEESCDSNSSHRKRSRLERSFKYIPPAKSNFSKSKEKHDKEYQLMTLNTVENMDEQIFFHKDIPLIFGGLNIDRLHNYLVYYPYNNHNIVVEFMKKFSRKTMASSKMKNEVSTRNRMSNATGLIEFRNQKLYFMKKNMLRKPTISSRTKSPKRGASVFFKKSIAFSEVIK